MAFPLIAGAVLGGIGGAVAVGGATAVAIGAGLGASIGGQVHASGQAAEAAREQARLSNEAVDRQWAYDMDLWDMTKERITDDRQYALEEIRTKAKNERTLAEYRDATNLANYGYQLQIRNREQESLNNQYLRSTNIYGLQTTLNADTARDAREDELRKLQEINAESSFQLQEMRIEQMQAEGTLRARGVTGRSAVKAQQASVADLGRQMAMMDESLASAGRNTKAVLRDIQRDKISADLTAYANRMLDPGVLPDVVAPFQTPLAEYLDPRELTDADFGPQPVSGARVSASAASQRAWASGISGIAGTIGSFASGILG
tara:strand:+ start:1080 stop:2033 length:954 start_codon:yes stop_codon:yes gene_type:complete